MFCDADVSVWQNEELLLLRGGDVFEVRVAHVAEVDVPRRDGEPEPEWLPLRIGLERRGLLTARPRKRRRWLGRLVRFDRPGHTSMVLTGLFMAVAFVAAPLLWILAMQSRESPLLDGRRKRRRFGPALRGKLVLVAEAPRRRCAPARFAVARFGRRTRRRADAAKKELQALLAPLRDKAKAALGSAGQWLEATARRASREAAAVQDTAAGGAERLVDAGGDAFDTLVEQWESGEFLDHWDAAADPSERRAWSSGTPRSSRPRSTWAAFPPGRRRAAPPQDDAPADDASMETSNGAIEGAAATLEPTPPRTRRRSNRPRPPRRSRRASARRYIT